MKGPAREQGALTYALVDASGNVVNTITMKPGANWTPSVGLELVLAEDENLCEQGGQYNRNNKKFTKAAIPSPPVP